MITDPVADVRAIAEAALSGPDDFGVSAAWQSLRTDAGNAACWTFLVTLPSLITGEAPLAVSAGPLITQSLPQPPQVALLMEAAVIRLRKMRAAQAQSLRDARSALGRLN
jgi:hypothetical protein